MIPDEQMPIASIGLTTASGGTKSATPLYVYGNPPPVNADWVTMPEKASIAMRPLAS